MSDPSMDAGDGGESAPLWYWIVLSAIACASFWCQAAVTEERLVPALNVIADYYNIPSDIAGATLMAAGASSPELFSSFVSLFITHSSLGLGTIVGSEIFNQLIICAGAVYASKTGTLALDKAIVIREVGFYALGIVLLYIALQDSEVDPSDPSGIEHIYVSFFDACILFAGYLAYVAVCANMDTVVGWFGGKSGTEGESIVEGKEGYGAVSDKPSARHLSMRDMPSMPFMHNITSEPVENWQTLASTVEMYTSETASQKDGVTAIDPLNTQSSRGSSRSGKSALSMSIRNSLARFGASSYVQTTERPTELFGMYEIRFNEYTQELECFLWQRSVFYTRAYFGSNAWHLRWFTITPKKISSIPDRQDPEKHKMTYPKFVDMAVDAKRLIICITNPHEGKRDFVLMAPSKAVFDKVVETFEKYMGNNINTVDEEQEGAEKKTFPPAITEESATEEYDDADAHVDLIEFPIDGSNVEIVFWILLYPLRFLMHYTLPDVRQLNHKGELLYTGSQRIMHAFGATTMCLVWLIVGSYAMVASLENLAALMNIPDAVIGFTVSAAGTSLPNYVASKVAAENGFGNQAVSNAFGSNTFNIMMGLGFPWLLYIASTGFEPYHGLRNEGIVESILILAIVLLVFIVLMLLTGFVILKWHGILFVIMYVAYVAYAVGQVYLGNNPH